MSIIISDICSIIIWLTPKLKIKLEIQNERTYKNTRQ